MRYEVAVDIDAPADAVWQIVHDVTRWSEWSPTIDEIRLLDDGAFDVGSTARVSQPKMSAMVWRVTENEPGRSFTWSTKTAGTTIVAGHYITAAEQRSHVVLTLAMDGATSPLLAALAGRRIRRYVDLEAHSLKRRCEQQTAG